MWWRVVEVQQILAVSLNNYSCDEKTAVQGSFSLEFGLIKKDKNCNHYNCTEISFSSEA
jgi:hypothetical protein